MFEDAQGLRLTTTSADAATARLMLRSVTISTIDRPRSSSSKQRSRPTQSS